VTKFDQAAGRGPISVTFTFGLTQNCQSALQIRMFV
jgi:hypothetical protein